MLVHPYDNNSLTTHEGTRLLDVSLNVVGAQVFDPRIPVRRWTIQSLFAPIQRRMIGGIRARLVDDYGFISFINQRDLEVLLGRGVPGTTCPWTGRKYIGVGERDWCGLFVDDDDLIDDLQLRELELRLQQAAHGFSTMLVPGTRLTRRVHVDEGMDIEDTYTLLWDAGYSDLARIEERWDRTSRRRIEWSR